MYAVCLSPGKLGQALGLMCRGCRLKVITGLVEGAQSIVAKARSSGQPFAALIEIDTDGHRSGVKPEDASLIELGRLLHEGRCTLEGVMTHAGSSYDHVLAAGGGLEVWPRFSGW